MKEQAKQILAEHSPTQVTLAFLLSTLGLSLIVNFVIPEDFIYALLQGDFNALNGNGTVYLFLMLLVTLFGWVMNYGYQQWALQTVEGKQTNLSTLIEGFGIAEKVLFLSFLKSVCMFCYLWVATLVVMLFPAMFLLSTSPTLIMAFLTIFMALCLAYLYLRYCLADLFLISSPEQGAYQAIKKAVIQQNAHFKELFKLHLSFWNWAVLFFLASQFYNVLLLGFNSIMNPGDFDHLLTTYNPVAYWLSMGVDWFLLFKFCPLYYVTLGIFFQKILVFPSQPYRN